MNPETNGEPLSHEEVWRVAEATFGFFAWNLADDKIEHDVALRQMLGHEPSTEMTEPWYLHIEEGRRTAFLTDLREVIKYGGATFARVCKLVDAAGNSEWYLIKAAVLRDERNNPESVVGTLVKVSQLLAE